jgi:hypothetical protein
MEETSIDRLKNARNIEELVKIKIQNPKDFKNGKY